MLVLQSPLIRTTIRTLSVSRPLTVFFKTQLRPLKSPSRFLVKSPSRFLVLATNGSNDDKEDPLTKEAEQEEQQPNRFVNGDGGGDDSRKDGRPIFNFKLGDLLNPDPDNIVAIGLTGLLTWASVQILGQLFFISLAILLAALKYSFIAALLIFILIALL